MKIKIKRELGFDFSALLSGCKVLLRVLASIVARRDGSEQMCLLFIGFTLPIKRKKIVFRR